MKLYEYQANELFCKYDIPVTKGFLAYTPYEAYKGCSKLKGKAVIKAQVHTGGRGKSGGVKFAKSPKEAEIYANEIIGMNINDFTVDKVFVVEALEIEKEYYLGIILDRNNESITAMFSEEGGVEIEEVSQNTPEKIKYAFINPLIGYSNYHSRELFGNTELTKEQYNAFHSIATKLYKLLIEKDCSLAEINPLCILRNGDVIAADSKINIDDNALYRQPHISSLKEILPNERNEEEAKTKGLSFVQLNGNIGCMVNGAGLAMATMDLIKHYKGSPANFLDVGGSSNPEKVVYGLKLILSGENIKAILINIFGGITRCDDIAGGLLEALNLIDINIPLIVRLTGTASDKAMDMLKTNNKVIPVNTMEEAVKTAIEKAKY
ncbi:MAG: ADP-forming succinate--CoA ligase subunit beta [Spirochaetota bacterium]